MRFAAVKDVDLRIFFAESGVQFLGRKTQIEHFRDTDEKGVVPAAGDLAGFHPGFGVDVGDL